MQYKDLSERSHNLRHPNTDKSAPKKSFNHNEFRVREFLEDYGQALSNGKVDQLANMWSYPSLVVGEQMLMAVTSPDQVRNFFAQARKQHNRQGIMHTHPVIEGLEWPTAHVAMVWVRWPYVVDNNQAHYHESAVYTLKCDDSGEVKILQAIVKGSEADQIQDIWN